jgi:hypothetical protein
MADQNDNTGNPKPSLPPLESSDHPDLQKTQAVKLPYSQPAKGHQDGTIPAHDALDPVEKLPELSSDTAILSRNNPLLKRALSHQGAHQPDDDTATLVEKREVILVIRGVVERIVMEENRGYRLGRFDIGTKRLDDIDLTAYGAVDRGVSRVHAQLQLEQEKLYITDLGSTNGTYVNGKRLTPQEPAMLRKGDDVLLGRLALQILFR